MSVVKVGLLSLYVGTIAVETALNSISISVSPSYKPTYKDYLHFEIKVYNNIADNITYT